LLNNQKKNKNKKQKQKTKNQKTLCVPSGTGADRHGSAQYCLLRLVEAKLGQEGYVGLCVPGSCTSAELSAAGGEAITVLLAHLGIADRIAFDVDCTQATTELDGKAIACLVLTFGLIAMCVLATTVDLIEQRLARVARRRRTEDAERRSINDAGGYAPLHDGGESGSAANSVNGSAGVSGVNGSTGANGSSGVNGGSGASGGGTSSASAAAAKPSPLWYKILRCFRVNHNLSRLNAPNPVENLTALNGLRVISILGIILGHTHLYMLNVGVTNPGYIVYRTLGRWSVVFISGCELFVDIFFFLSGFLVAFGALKELKRKGRIPWGVFYLHRYLRLTPAYVRIYIYIYGVDWNGREKKKKTKKH
jgi:hypothetical protein